MQVSREQIESLKPGDKVRLRSDRGSWWISEMDKFFNSIVTIESIAKDKRAFQIGGGWFVKDEDIVEIISNEPNIPSIPSIPSIPDTNGIKYIPDTKWIKKDTDWKTRLINEIKKLPYTGGVLSTQIEESERDRIIDLIKSIE